MSVDVSKLTATIKTTVKKFDGDQAFDPNAQPVEVIEREDVVPVSSLSPAIQQQLLKGK